MKGAIALTILFGLLFAGCAWDLENSPDSLLFKKVKKIEKKREEMTSLTFYIPRI
jgi:uncharacterized membrane protein YqjE